MYLTHLSDLICFFIFCLVGFVCFLFWYGNLSDANFPFKTSLEVSIHDYWSYLIENLLKCILAAQYWLGVFLKPSVGFLLLLLFSTSIKNMVAKGENHCIISGALLRFFIIWWIHVPFSFEAERGLPGFRAEATGTWNPPDVCSRNWTAKHSTSLSLFLYTSWGRVEIWWEEVCFLFCF